MFFRWDVASCGFYIASVIDQQKLDIAKNSCLGVGACGGIYTTNTMASAIETMGMTLPYGLSTPAEYPVKLEECFNASIAIRNLLEKDIKPSDIMTEKALKIK
ncbi:hypothetical protein Glove_213g184 [Diversispora epigaea]|uniref:Dihydroxy-acid/6-phosphogluconate dehydratase N-terminal domain-containing protein n=1 Tax=Diversispora epigaea TaxID=1348612 RepID=A0A397IHU6_9GLOM|nr:hypothetical protein Glove_213g184 [Diversispora epigaea]